MQNPTEKITPESLVNLLRELIESEQRGEEIKA